MEFLWSSNEKVLDGWNFSDLLMKRCAVSLTMMYRWVELLWSSNEKVCCKSVSNVQMGETSLVF